MSMNILIFVAKCILYFVWKTWGFTDFLEVYCNIVNAEFGIEFGGKHGESGLYLCSCAFVVKFFSLSQI